MSLRDKAALPVISGFFTVIFLLLTSGCASEPRHAPLRPRSEDHDRSPQSVGKIQLIWPMTSRKIGGEFLDARKRHLHKGIDIMAPQGTRIYAPAAGKVVYTGKKFRGYGNLIVIEHANHFATFFGHCSRILVREGTTVRQGSLIGLVGKTGRASTPHLHFEVRVNEQPVDPLEFLP